MCNHPPVPAYPHRLCSCGEPLTLEMERSADTCCECQRDLAILHPITTDKEISA